MKPKKKTKVIKRWLANPGHLKRKELREVKVVDLLEHLTNEWQSYLTLIGKPELEHELTVGLMAKTKKPDKQQLHEEEDTNIFFDITDLMPHPTLFHTYATAAAQVPYYLLHQEWNGRVFATFNPYIWENPTRCMTTEVARFSMLAQLKVIAGHRNSTLQGLKNLEAGDLIVVETASGYYIYEVSEHYIVPPTQVEVVAPVPNEPGVQPTERLLTLITCYPDWGNTERRIIHATFKEWQPHEVDTPASLQ